MPECIFTCPTCGREIRWNNEREREPLCPTCSTQEQIKRHQSYPSGSVLDWWGKTESAWRAKDLREATRCLLEILHLDPDLDQVAWKNLVMTDRVDMSGVPENLMTEVREIVKKMGPRAVDSPEARHKRLQLVATLKNYV